MISRKLENKYGIDIHTPRIESLEYWHRLIEDVTNLDILNVQYNVEKEFLRVNFCNKKKLLINIHLDSLSVCTLDILRQTKTWCEENNI